MKAPLSAKVRQIIELARQIEREEMEENSRRTGRPLVTEIGPDGLSQWSIPLDHDPIWYHEEAARRLGYRLVRHGSVTCHGRPPAAPERPTLAERLRRFFFG